MRLKRTSAQFNTTKEFCSFIFGSSANRRLLGQVAVLFVEASFTNSPNREPLGERKRPPPKLFVLALS